MYTRPIAWTTLNIEGQKAVIFENNTYRAEGTDNVITIPVEQKARIM